MDILARRRRKFFGVCTGKGLLGTPGGVGGWSGDLSGRHCYPGFLSGWTPMLNHRIIVPRDLLEGCCYRGVNNKPPPMINPPLSFFGDFLKIIKPPSTFSREAREIFWAFWAFNGDFLTKFGKF